MTPELENELYQICPSFFYEAIACQNGEMTEMDTCMFFGCECNDGWFEPLKKFALKLKLINELAAKQNFQYVCTQLKEKYAELRIYYSIKNVDNNFNINHQEIEIIQNMFSDALKTVEDECWNTCELCGKKNDYKQKEIVMTRDWMTRICRTCAKNYEDGLVKKFDEKNNREYKPRIISFTTCYDFLSKFDKELFAYGDNKYDCVWTAYYYNYFKNHPKEELRYLSSCFSVLCDKKIDPNYFYTLGDIFMKEHNLEHDKELMKNILLNKYSENYIEEFKATKGYDIVYFNYHCDNYFGVCLCDKCKDIEHHNYFGNLLTEIRDNLYQ